jgi:hypothetical protein
MTTMEVQRLAAIVRPATVDLEARTVELVIASDQPVDGLSLQCTRQAVSWGPAPVPVLLSHKNSTDTMAGRITDVRFERGLLIGLAQFTDAPAADQGWQLASAGCAVSVGARIDQEAIRPLNRETEQATKWQLLEASLVPIGADPLALTRSHTQLPQEGIQTMAQAKPAAPAAVQIETEEVQRSTVDLKRENRILRSAAAAGLAADEAQELVASNRSADECVQQILQRMADRINAAPAGHPALGRWVEGAKDPLADAIERAFEGKPLERSLIQTLKDAGYVGRSGEEVIRNAFVTGKRSNLIERGFHSTSDAKDLLLSTGDRRLQDRHSEAPRGILELARVRQLSDFREASVIDAGLVGGAVKLNEGAEIRYGSLNSDAGKYKPSRYGLGLSFSFEALANDDLGGISAVLDELSATMVESESNFVGELLFGSAGEGGLCPDGLPLFDVAHGNTPATDATLSTQGLSAMVELLRRQTSVGGRKIWLSPGYILVGPDLETTALQLFSESWNATEPDDTNPWKSLRLIVDPTVEEGYFYLAASGNRKPFEVGRVEGMPQMRQEEDFNTSGMRMKIEHAYGGACVDHRVIVRNKRIPD